MRQVKGNSGSSYRVDDQPLRRGGRSVLIRCREDGGQARVYKQYDSAITDADAVTRLKSLAGVGRAKVLEAERQDAAGTSPQGSINWPIDLVRGPGGKLAGVILPLIPAPFFGGDGKLRTLDRFAPGQAAVPPAARMRVSVLIRVCEILGSLEASGLIHGEVEPGNLAWHGDPSRAYLVGCDGLRAFNAPPGRDLPQPAPDWRDPRLLKSRIAAHDQYSDRYGVALLMYRGLFLNPDLPRFQDDGDLWIAPGGFPIGLDPRLRTLFNRAFDDPFETDGRPSAARWRDTLVEVFLSSRDYQPEPIGLLDNHVRQRRASSSTGASSSTSALTHPLDAFPPPQTASHPDRH